MYTQNPALPKVEKGNQQRYAMQALSSAFAWIRSNLTRFINQNPRHEDILLFRILHFSCASMFILFYYIYQNSIPDVVDSLPQRSILAFISIVITGSSYSSKWIYKHFLRISYLVFFLYNTWILYMLNTNDFAPEFVLSYFALLVGVGTVIQRKDELIIFSISTIAIYSVLIFLNENSKVNPYMSVITLLSLQAFIYALMNVKIQQVQVIKKKSKLLKKKNEETFESLRYAKRIQSAILPSDHLIQAHLKDSFVLYKPKDVVAGDFYWFESCVPCDSTETQVSLKEVTEAEGTLKNTVLFALADCTGHGVPGAMVSVVCHNALNRSVREFGLIDPGNILDKTRQIVVQEFKQSNQEVKDGMDIALISITANSKVPRSSNRTYTLHYAGAHRPIWIIKSGSEEIIEVKADRQPVGSYFAEYPFKTRSLEVYSGDSIYMFSDGYIDQFGGPKNKKFKTTAFRELLLEIKHYPMHEQPAILESVFEDWKGINEQVDDVCVAGIKL